MKKTLSELGIKYGIFGAMMIVCEIVIPILARLILKERYEDCKSYVSLITTVIAVYIIGFPLCYFLTKNMPNGDIQKQKMPIKTFLLMILMSFGCLTIGNMAGLPIHVMLSIPSQFKGMNGLSDIVLNINPLLSICVTGILAPIFEELICRKIIVDKLSVHNEYLAIITSGLVFGLIHGNFQQGAFAFLLGCLFAYVYLRTGNVIYTIIMHMTINMTSALITVPILKKVLEESNGLYATSYTGEVDPNQISLSLIIWMGILMLWLLIFAAIGQGGVVALIIARVKKKIALPSKDKAVSKKEMIKTLLTAPGMWLFYSVGIVFFLETYLLPIFRK